MRNPFQDLLEFSNKFGESKRFYLPPLVEKKISSSITPNSMNIFIRSGKVASCEIRTPEKDEKAYIPSFPPRSGKNSYMKANQFYEFAKYLTGKAKEYFLLEIAQCAKDLKSNKAQEIHDALRDYDFETIKDLDKVCTFFIFYEDEPKPVFAHPEIRQWIQERKSEIDPDATEITCTVTGKKTLQVLPLTQIPQRTLNGQDKSITIFTDNMEGGQNSIVSYNGYFNDSGASGSSQREKSCSVDFLVNERIVAAITYIAKNQKIRTSYEKSTNVLVFSTEDEFNFDPNAILNLDNNDGESQEISRKLVNEILKVMNGGVKDDAYWESDAEVNFLTVYPNASRLSVGDYCKLKVSEFCEHLLDHYRYLSVKDQQDQSRPIPFWKARILEFDTVLIMEKMDDAFKRLSSIKEEKWIRAVFFGEDYPVNLDNLLSKYITDHVAGRICLTSQDHGDKGKKTATYLNRERIALIRAILNRRFRIGEEQVRETQAYKLGMLFGFLEHSEGLFHNNQSIGKGVLGRMRIANQTPVSVYPDLYIKHKQVYFRVVVNSGSKNAGYMHSIDKKITNLMKEISTFPARFRKPSDRAAWVLGYADARSEIDTNNTKEQDDES